jgi:DNA-binding FrmR family transcriptional regulator
MLTWGKLKAIVTIPYPSILYVPARLSLGRWVKEGMAVAHTIRDKQKLINRVRRIRGQLDAVEKALNEEHECFAILQTLAACRGAMNGLVAEVIEGHIRFHVVNPDEKPTSQEAKAAQQLIEIVKSYVK